MISFDRREALRYMGYHGAEPDAAVAEGLERCAAELQAAVQPKSISARFPLSFTGENTMQIGDLTVTSANLARNLQGLHGSIPDGGDTWHRRRSADRARFGSPHERCCYPAGGGGGHDRDLL